MQVGLSPLSLAMRFESASIESKIISISVQQASLNNSVQKKGIFDIDANDILNRTIDDVNTKKSD